MSNELPTEDELHAIETRLTAALSAGGYEDVTITDLPRLLALVRAQAATIAERDARLAMATMFRVGDNTVTLASFGDVWILTEDGLLDSRFPTADAAFAALDAARAKEPK